MEKSKYKKILRNFKMGDPKGLEALKKKILEEQEDGEYENQNLIDNDMGEFQNPKNAQMLPYDEEKWEVSFDSLRMLEPIGSGIKVEQSTNFSFGLVYRVAKLNRDCLLNIHLKR